MNKKESAIINRELPAKTAVAGIQSDIEATERNSLRYQERNFALRMEMIDFIEFHVIDRLEELLERTTQPDQVDLLKHRAERIKEELEEINTNLFQKLRTNIRTAGYTGKEFKELVNEYVDLNSPGNNPEEGYGNLDIFINGLMPAQSMPEQTKDLEPEMVFYQKTPARIVFELVKRSHFRKEDVFFDLGSGLGQVAILVNLLTGITVKGVEFEPAFCDYARDCAAALNLSDITFINADARRADYSEGTIFFMFTPFKGEMMQEVLEILRIEALQRKIKLITYGPCTNQVALQNWLHPASPIDDNIYKPAVFTSL